MKKYHHCVKFTYPLSFQTRIPKVDQHTGGKWLIHGTKHRKDNQLQSLELYNNSIIYLSFDSVSQPELYGHNMSWICVLLYF